MKTREQQDFTIGCDPEFICLKDGELLAAEDYAEQNCFGSDGGGIAFEMRPDYSTNPLRVVNNIHKNFLQLVSKNTSFMKYEWRAGSYIQSQPIGGHIHFGGVRNLSTSAACEWLDQFVGACTVLIEDCHEGRKRREHGYGMKGDHRVNDWGFEYRTASSWLTSPYVTAAVLCLAKAVVHEGIKRGKTKPPRFVGSPQINEMQVVDIRKKFDSIWAAVTNLELYPEYKPQIDLIYTLVKNNRTWFPKQSMKTSWGIMNMSRQTVKPTITLKSIWADVAKAK